MASFAASVGDALRHVIRREEAGVGRVEHGDIRLGGGGLLSQIGVAVLVTLRGPGTTAFLHKPKSDDIFKQPDGAAVADLVGEVQFAAGVGDDRLWNLQPHQRPGAGADVGPALVLGRARGDRAGGVVRKRRNDVKLAQASLGGQAGLERAKRCRGRSDLGKNGVG